MISPSFSWIWSQSSQRRRLSFPGGTARPGPAPRTEAGRWEYKYFNYYFFGKQEWVWRFWVLHSLGVCEREARLGVAAVLLQGSGVEVQLWRKWKYLCTEISAVIIFVVSETHCHPPVESQPWSRGETQCPLAKENHYHLVNKYFLCEFIVCIPGRTSRPLPWSPPESSWTPLRGGRSRRRLP